MADMWKFPSVVTLAVVTQSTEVWQRYIRHLAYHVLEVAVLLLQVPAPPASECESDERNAQCLWQCTARVCFPCVMPALHSNFIDGRPA